MKNMGLPIFDNKISTQEKLNKVKQTLKKD